MNKEREKSYWRAMVFGVAFLIVAAFDVGLSKNNLPLLVFGIATAFYGGIRIGMAMQIAGEDES